MSYTPISRKEADEANLTPKGKYPFEIQKSQDATSQKTGEAMYKINVTVYAEDGETFVYDYIVLNKQWAWKLAHLADSVGLWEEYSAGRLTAESLNGRSGYLQLGIQKAKNGFPAKNVVSDYLPMQAESAQVSENSTPPHEPSAKVDAETDGSIPF